MKKVIGAALTAVVVLFATNSAFGWDAVRALDNMDLSIPNFVAAKPFDNSANKNSDTDIGCLKEHAFNLSRNVEKMKRLYAEAAMCTIALTGSTPPDPTDVIDSIETGDITVDHPCFDGEIDLAGKPNYDSDVYAWTEEYIDNLRSDQLTLMNEYTDSLICNIASRGLPPPTPQQVWQFLTTGEVTIDVPCFKEKVKLLPAPECAEAVGISVATNTEM